MKSWFLLVISSVLFIGCQDGFKYNKDKSVTKLGGNTTGFGASGSTTGGTTAGTTGNNTGSTTGGTSTGSTTGSSTSGSTTGGNPPPPPNEESTVDGINNANPGMINDCTGIPIVNNFLLTVVRTLQGKNSRWGFMKKSSPFRIPRDVLAYRWSSEGEGTHKFFVIDFVSAGCNNWPGAPEYNDPMPNAGVWWNLTNPDGIADNGTWSFDP